MERIVTTSQAAQILGLSLQGVHYRIKQNQLKSIKKSGKTFVYITPEMEKNAPLYNPKVEPVKTIKNEDVKTLENNNQLQSIIEVKDEQINLLKDSMKWMKKQYKSEIVRLEKNQKRIVNVFNSEIKLLQSAFNEMRSIYKNQPQIEPLNTHYEVKNEEIEFISLKDFFVIMKKFDKTEHEIKTIIFKAIRDADKRFIYNKKEKKLLILKSDFTDLINK